jgi:hypothetical protein
MVWENLLQHAASGYFAFPWLGGRKIHGNGRTWRVVNKLPPEFGWCLFELKGGRTAKYCEQAEPLANWENEHHTTRGYIVGDRFIPERARVDPDPERLAEQTIAVYLVERGLDRFAPCLVAFEEENRAIFVRQLFDSVVEEKAREAFIDRRVDIASIRDVPPALDLAFRFASRQRELVERRRLELEKQRLEEERREAALKSIGTGLGRRQLATTDFAAAARAALAVSGAEFLDAREAHGRNEMIVQYRFMNRRFECVVDRLTLRLTDSGVCLQDHRGVKGDTRFTLESIPGVISEAIRENKLHIYRHVDDEEEDYW